MSCAACRSAKGYWTPCPYCRAPGDLQRAQSERDERKTRALERIAMTNPKPPAASDVERLQRIAEMSETKSRPGPVNADERGRALAVVRKLNGWQPSPFDPVDQELAVSDVAAALREVAKGAQFRILAVALRLYDQRTEYSFAETVDHLRARIEKDGPL